MSIDWYYATEYTIAGALGSIPEVGGLLSTLVYILWPPEHVDVWAEIEAQVEQFVQQEFNQEILTIVGDSLAGLQAVIDDYNIAIASGDNEIIRDTWVTAELIFDYAMPFFQSTGYEVLLLPLFAQAINLKLSFLRDGVLFGADWGFNEAFCNSLATKLTDTISDAMIYVDNTYQQGWMDITAATSTNYAANQPFLAVNTYVRQMNLTVLDFMQMWPYFDPSQYPFPVTIYIDREIYSDPVGSCADSGAIEIPTPPTQPISSIWVWGQDYMDAVQLNYPAGGGPGGVTQTARMGDQDGGTLSYPTGLVFYVADFPVVSVTVTSGNVLNSLAFTNQNGQVYSAIGTQSGSTTTTFNYNEEIMSSIFINGVNETYGTADCIIFGFNYPQSSTANLEALRLLYVGSPTEMTVDQLAARCVSRAVDLEKLQAKASSEAWHVQQQEYREMLRLRVDRRSE